MLKLSVCLQGFKSLSEILLTDEVRRENRSVDWICSQFLVYEGADMPPNAQNNAIQWKKTLIFPEQKYYVNEDGHRISIHNGLEDEFKGLMEIWHEKIRPGREKLLQCSREASALHLAIEKLKTDAKIDGFGGDNAKLKELW